MLFLARSLLLATVLSVPAAEVSHSPLAPPPAMLHVTPNLMVKDVQQTVTFYQQLGFQVLTTVPEQAPFAFALVQAGEVQLMFQEEHSLKEEYPVLNTTQPGPGLTLYIKVQEVQQLYGQLKDRVKVLKTPHKMFYGATEFAIQDNNGFVLTFSGE